MSHNNCYGTGCGGAVGRAVASDTRNPWFEPQHLQEFRTLSTALKCRKDKNIIEKRPEKARLKIAIKDLTLNLSPNLAQSRIM